MQAQHVSTCAHKLAPPRFPFDSLWTIREVRIDVVLGEFLGGEGCEREVDKVLSSIALRLQLVKDMDTGGQW